MRILQLTLVAVLFVGCPKRGGEEESALWLARRIEQIDEAWAARGDDGFSPVHSALTEGEVAFPDHPELAWRWSRYSTGRGLAAPDPDTARHHFAEARGAGLRCLLADPVFDARQAELGWEPALEVLPADREPCALWTAFAWLKWMEQIGARAAELDFARIEPLLDHLRLTTEDQDGRLTWSRGLAETLKDRAQGLSSPRGRALLAQAVDAKPDELARTVDLLLVADAEITGDLSRYLERALRAAAHTPEDERAQERLRALAK